VIDTEDLQEIRVIRQRTPELIERALAARRRRASPMDGRKLFLVAADHPARAALGAGTDPLAMADRAQLLTRLAQVLRHPRVDGFVASADLIEDLLLLDLLEDKLVFGTMNRGGLQASCWELDDAMTAYDAAHLRAGNLDGGKMLLRIDRSDRDSARTLERCARAVSDLADRQLVALVEPLPYRTGSDGRRRLDDRIDHRIRAVTVAAGLGHTSAYTWLKVPAGAGCHRVLEATTCPTLILGGEVEADASRSLGTWAEALQHPACRGLVVGRNLLYPTDGDVDAMTDAVAELVDGAAGEERSP
jgi:hypothetical protein